jgi:hypothetical protein
MVTDSTSYDGYDGSYLHFSRFLDFLLALFSLCLPPFFHFILFFSWVFYVYLDFSLLKFDLIKDNIIKTIKQALTISVFSFFLFSLLENKLNFKK